VHEPAATIVTVDPDTVHIDVVRDVNATVKPDDAVADTENAASPYVFPANEPNEIV